MTTTGTIAGIGGLINTGALTLVGGGTGLANALSIGAVGSAVGLGLAAYALTRPREKGGYQQQSSGYHKRRGHAARHGGGGPARAALPGKPGKDARVIMVSKEHEKQGRAKNQGPKRQGKVNTQGHNRQGKGNSQGPIHEIKVLGGSENGGQGWGRQGKQRSGPSRPVKVIARAKTGGIVGPKVNHRTKREQQDYNLRSLDALQYEEQLELQETLEIIRQHDTTGCGKRLMCELGGMPQEELTIEELSILNLVRPNGTNVRRRVKPSQASLEYLDAKTKGQQGEKCGNVYPLCTLNGKQLMNIVMEYLP